MSDRELVERMRSLLVDFDGRQLMDGEVTIYDVHAGDLRKLLDAIERLTRERNSALSYADHATEAERERCARICEGLDKDYAAGYASGYRAALEAAATACESTYPVFVGGSLYHQQRFETPQDCATAIRALKVPE